MLAKSVQASRQLSPQHDKAAAHTTKPAGLKDLRLCWLLQRTDSASRRLPDNSLFGKVKQHDSSFQSCQQYVWIFSEAYISHRLRYLGFCMPVKKVTRAIVCATM